MPSHWRLLYSKSVLKELGKLDGTVAGRLTKYMSERVMVLDDPRKLGKALKGSTWGDMWRYRCGDYRIIAQIVDLDVVVIVVRVGHRKDVY